MNSWKIILATVVIFGCGVVTGGLLVNYVQHPRFGGHRPAAGDHDLDLPLPRPQVMNAQFVQQLDAKLNLTPDQRDKITKIIADGQQHNRELSKLVAPQMHLVIQDVRQKIRAVLTPEQRKEFEDLMKQQRVHHPSSTNAPPALTTETNGPAPTLTNLPPGGSPER